MNYYQLEDKLMDECFLKGGVVRVRAALSPEEVKVEKIKPGDQLLVLLSNGTKYKGKIIHFERLMINGYAIGEIDIRRDHQGTINN